MAENLASYVSPGDIFSAIKTLYGQFATVLEYDVQRATASVQGFTSLMLRVNTTVKVNENTTEKTSIILKRMPILQTQLDMFSEMDLFEKEITYFTKVVPILKSINSNLPIVNCIHAYDRTIVMEDLCKYGYETMAKNVRDMTNDDLIDISHMRLAVRKLAQLHATTIDINWEEKLGKYVQNDTLFDGVGAETFKKTFDRSAKSISILIKELYPNNHEKYTKWLLSDKYFKYLRELARPNSKLINLLCHGDFWVNNMMFKLDPITKHPLDVKFIDLQIFRYASPVTDLLYFLYMCTGMSIREKYEKEVIQTYVEAFNAAVCETPDRFNIKSFTKEYESRRFFGVGIALTFRTMILLDSIFPKEGGQLTTEQFEAMLHEDHTEEVINKFHNDDSFKSEISIIINEAISVLDKAGVIE
jgi:aminoglycoside/choline kinase family phosphotransferase